MTQAYVYNGKEVYLTGRTATKTGRGGKVSTLYEISPIKYQGKVNPLAGQVEEWVQLSVLHKINTTTQEDEDNE